MICISLVNNRGLASTLHHRYCDYDKKGIAVSMSRIALCRLGKLKVDHTIRAQSIQFRGWTTIDLICHAATDGWRKRKPMAGEYNSSSQPVPPWHDPDE